MTAHATLLYGGLTTLLSAALSIGVSRVRGQQRHFGHANENPEVFRWARVHSNLSENGPLMFVALLACELSGASAVAAHVLGGVFLASRVMHAVGWIARIKGVAPLGAGLSVACLGATGAYAVWLHFHPVA